MEIEVLFQHGEDTLSGSLHIPSKQPPHSVMIMVQGSGPADRNNDVFFPPIRDFFLRTGYAVLCYDKPGVGGSTGNWKTQSFQDRASEVLAAVSYLKNRAAPHFHQIGLFGHSQGGWIVFLVASQSESIDFVISNSGPAISPAEQDKFGLIHTNLQIGVSQTEIDQALYLHDQLVEAAQDDLGFDHVSEIITQQTNYAWENYFKFDAESWIFFKKNFAYDPLPALTGTQCPSLVLLGGKDPLVPAEHCIPIFQSNLKQSACQIHLFLEADHRMKVDGATKFDSDYFNIIGSWLAKID